MKKKLCPSCNFCLWDLSGHGCWWWKHLWSPFRWKAVFSQASWAEVCVLVGFGLLSPLGMSWYGQWRQLGNRAPCWVGCGLGHWSFWVQNAQLVATFSLPAPLVHEGVGGLCCAHCQSTVPFPCPSLPFGMWLTGIAAAGEPDLSPDLWGRDLCHSVQEFSALQEVPLYFFSLLMCPSASAETNDHEEWPELRYKISCSVLKSPHSGVILSLTFTPLVTVGRLFNPVPVSSSVHGKQG